ncbi:MAG TPA: multidrug ABC transporter substrate-binding protein, partial [Dysgonomonas sp.]|nr:multidrug ABC transporter substrate-binding protein [Dysgonomonas sp.]
MKQILLNVYYVLKRFKSATLLNVIGLSVAFAAFMVIMMQVNFDYNFNKTIDGHESIYRIEILNSKKGHIQATMPRPMADIIFRSSPHILAGGMEHTVSKEIFFSIDKPGNKDIYKEMSHGVASDYTDVFPFEMVEGDRHVLQNPEYVLIPQSLSEKLFGNESPIGQRLEKEQGSWVVGGVYKDFPKNSSLRNTIYYSIGNENLEKWTNWNYQVYIKVDSPDVLTGLDNIFKKVLSGRDEIDDISFHFSPLAETYYSKGIVSDSLPKSSKEIMAVLFAIGIIIVVIASVNFTNFSIALTPARIKAINTQKVLGAASSELRRILIAEAVFISIAAFIISLPIVFLIANSPVSELVRVTISLTDHSGIVLLTAVLAFVVGIISGLYPSYYMTSFPPALVLKGSFGLSAQGKKTRNVLIGIQFIASVTLIICAGFMYLQNQYFINRPYGYDKEMLIVSDISRQANTKWEVLKNELEKLPGLEKAEKSFALLGSREAYNSWGVHYKGDDEGITFQCIFAGPDFLDVLGIETTDGRNFIGADSISGAFIFNEAARNKYDLELGYDFEGLGRIVGFIPDINFATLRTGIQPMAFYVSENITKYNYVYMRVKSKSSLSETFERVRTAFASVDQDYPFDIRFFDDALNETYQKEKRLSSLIALFCLIAVFISIVGVFGLVVFECEYRRKEIGIRKVLGSSVKEVLLLFNKVYITILSICFVIAVPLCHYVMSRWLENFAYHIPLYWWVFAT